MIGNKIVDCEADTSTGGGRGGRVSRVAVQTKRIHSLELIVFWQRERGALVVFHDAGGVVELGVTRRAGGDILVDWGHLLVPADAETTALRDVEVELHTEHAGGTSGGDQTGVAVGAELLSHNELNDEVVLDLEATGGLHVANRVGGGVDASLELHADFTAGGVKVGLPASLLFVVADDTGLLVENPLVLAADLVRVLRAGGGDNLLVLLDAPHHLAQTPAGLSLVTLVDNAAQGHLHRELPNGVHH